MAAAIALPLATGLSEEQRAIQETVRAFVDDRVLPTAVANDRAHRLDWDLVRGMADLGLLGAVLPPEYDGSGLDWVAEVLICEELERGEAALRTLTSVHQCLNALAVLRYGSDDQRDRWLPAMADGRLLGCFGLTEPGAGSDVASMTASARRDGDCYVLNGQKTWISFAPVADLALCFARTDPDAGTRGISAFMIPLKETSGVRVVEIEDKLGMWAGPTGEIFLDDAVVPAENLVGEEGEGFKIAMYSLDQGRLTLAAGAVGVVRGCLEASVAYANERITFGKPIGQHQMVQDMIADIVLMYEQARLVVLNAARAKELARTTGARTTREVSIAKVVATEYAFKAADLAVQVHGGWGYAAEYGVERHLRNSRAPRLYEGTTQIHKMLLAEDALGIRKLAGR